MLAGDRHRMRDAPDRLPGDPAGHHQQNDGVGERGEDRASAQPIGKSAARLTAAEHRGAPGQREAEHVTEIVSGIGQQRERSGKNPGNRLAAEISQVQGDPDRKSTAVIFLGMPMSVVRMGACSCSTAPPAPVLPAYCTPSSSTSKISVAFGGMTPPAPRAP